MRYTDMKELGSYEGTIYRINVVVFNTYHLGVGSFYEDAVYWDDGENLHPFECVFTDRQEAIDYARTFSVAMAQDAHETGNGPEYEGVSVDVTENEFADGEYAEGEVIYIRDWMGDNSFSCVEWEG
jgi:hypothetical protein